MEKQRRKKIRNSLSPISETEQSILNVEEKKEQKIEYMESKKDIEIESYTCTNCGSNDVIEGIF